MPYIYETHLHTAEASACGKVPGKAYIDFMKSRGYQGMIVTDHFFNGNSCIPRNLPWKQRVEQYCSGFEHARLEANTSSFTVLFGIEYYFEGDEYLIYGVDKQWLLAHEDLLSLSRKEVSDRVHDGGGIMIQAHPYRERAYLSDIRLTPSICDGIEVFNAANEPYQNALAYEYAKKLDVPMSAGSDIHYFHEDFMGGMLFEEKIETIEDYISAFREGLGTPVLLKGKEVTPVCQSPSQREITSRSHVPVLYMEETPEAWNI